MGIILKLILRAQDGGREGYESDLARGQLAAALSHSHGYSPVTFPQLHLCHIRTAASLSHSHGCRPVTFARL